MIIGCMSSLTQFALAKSLNKSVSQKKDVPKSDSKIPRLLHLLNETDIDKSDHSFINVSGKKYPKNAVGDFRRTESINWKIYSIKPKHPNPLWTAPPGLPPKPIEIRNLKNKNANLNRLKKKTSDTQKSLKK